MGRLSLTELAYLLLDAARADAGRAPHARRRARVARRPRPDAERARRPAHLHRRARSRSQGAVAAGLLGAGSVFLGPTGDTAEFLAAALPRRRTPTDDATLRPIARTAVDARRRAGLRVPGLGHPVHRVEDPRTPRLYELAEEEGAARPPPRGCCAHVAEAHAERLAAGACRSTAPAPAGAALVDLGVPAGQRARLRAHRPHRRARRPPRRGGRGPDRAPAVARGRGAVATLLTGRRRN